jgi:hypothetical protein
MKMIYTFSLLVGQRLVVGRRPPMPTPGYATTFLLETTSKRKWLFRILSFL